VNISKLTEDLLMRYFLIFLFLLFIGCTDDNLTSPDTNPASQSFALSQIDDQAKTAECGNITWAYLPFSYGTDGELCYTYAFVRLANIKFNVYYTETGNYVQSNSYYYSESEIFSSGYFKSSNLNDMYYGIVSFAGIHAAYIYKSGNQWYYQDYNQSHNNSPKSGFLSDLLKVYSSHYPSYFKVKDNVKKQPNGTISITSPGNNAGIVKNDQFSATIYKSGMSNVLEIILWVTKPNNEIQKYFFPTSASKVSFTPTVAGTYSYRVSLSNGDCSSAGQKYSSSKTLHVLNQQLSAPGYVNISNYSGKPKLTWTSVANATSYVVYRDTQGDGSFERINISNVTTNSYVDDDARYYSSGTYTSRKLVAYKVKASYYGSLSNFSGVTKNWLYLEGDQIISPF
jgi:hypothetical protein